MRTTQVHQFIHEVPVAQALTNKKDGSHGRVAKGEAIGVMVARVVDDNHYAINVSLTHPGHEVKGGFRKGGDKFDKHIAITLALGKMVEGDALPRVFTQTPTTKRAKWLNYQFEGFVKQAEKIFKDKQRRTAIPR